MSEGTTTTKSDPFSTDKVESKDVDSTSTFTTETSSMDQPIFTGGSSGEPISRPYALNQNVTDVEPLSTASAPMLLSILVGESSTANEGTASIPGDPTEPDGEAAMFLLSQRIVHDLQIVEEAGFDSMDMLSDFQGDGTDGASHASEVQTIRRVQLLHKRASTASTLGAPSTFITTTNLDEMAVNTHLPQWLIYTWTEKSKDRTMKDPKTQQMIAEMMLLRRYCLPAVLCEKLPTTAHDVAVKQLLVFFQHIHRVLKKDDPKPATEKSTQSQMVHASLSSASTSSSSISVQIQPHHQSTQSSYLEGSSDSRISKTKKRDHIIGFLEEMIHREVQDAKTDASLFRSNNIVSRLLTLYANGIAKEYLCATLQPVIEQVILMGSMEVDPLKISEKDPLELQKILTSNMKKLLDATTMVLNAILYSVGRCPIGLKKLAIIIQRQVEKKFSYHRTGGVPSRLMRLDSSSRGSPLERASFAMQSTEKQPSDKTSVAPDSNRTSMTSCSSPEFRRASMSTSSDSHKLPVADKNPVEKTPTDILKEKTPTDILKEKTTGGVTSSKTTLETGSRTTVTSDEVRQHHVAVRGFIFLRVICPALVTPDTLGLIAKPLNTEQRRSLILISKVVQNVANGVRFGAKEAFMIPANSIAEEMELRVDRYCDALQSLDNENLYHASETTDDKIFGKKEDLDGTIISLMELIYKHLDKVLESLWEVDVSENMTYTVFSALKAIFRQFDAQEKAGTDLIEQNEEDLETEEGMDQEEFAIRQKDHALLRNTILLGGLEEVLAMNDFLLIRAMFWPPAFAKRQGTMGDNPASMQALVREMDALVRASVQVICPHGGNRLRSVVEWVVQQEISLRKSQLSEEVAEQTSEGDLLLSIFELPSGEEALQHVGTSLCLRLTTAFFFAFHRSSIQSSLQGALDFVLDPEECLEIDVTLLKNADELRTNLDCLVRHTQDVFDIIVQSGANLPTPIKKLCVNFFQILDGNMVDLQSPTSVAAMQSVAHILFTRVFCPMVSNPDTFGILEAADFEEGGDEGSLVIRKCILVGTMLRFLVQRATNPNPEPIEMVSSPAEREFPDPLATQWSNSLVEYMRQILSTANAKLQRASTIFAKTNEESFLLSDDPSPPLVRSPSLVQSPSLVRTSSYQLRKEDVDDEPIPIATGARARSLLILRKLLNRQNLKRTRAIVDTTHEGLKSKATSFSRPATMARQLTVENQSGSISSTKKELNGNRDHVLQYRLVDRMRIIFWSIYGHQMTPHTITRSNMVTSKDPEQNPLNSRARRGTSASKIHTEIQFDPQLQSSSSGGRSMGRRISAEHRPRSGSLLRNLPDESTMAQTKMSTLASSILAAQQATKNAVKHFFIGGGKGDRGDPNVTSKQSKRWSSSSNKSATANKSEDRGIMGILRAKRANSSNKLSKRSNTKDSYVESAEPSSDIITPSRPGPQP